MHEFSHRMLAQTFAQLNTSKYGQMTTIGFALPGDSIVIKGNPAWVATFPHATGEVQYGVNSAVAGNLPEFTGSNGVLVDSGVSLATVGQLSYVEAEYYLANNQNIAQNTAGPVAFDTAVTTNSAISYTLGSGVFTINKAGLYNVVASIMFTSSAVGTRIAYFNSPANTGPFYGQTYAAPPATGQTAIGLSFCRYFAAGSTFNLYGQISGTTGTLAFEGSSDVGASNACRILISGHN